MSQITSLNYLRDKSLQNINLHCIESFDSRIRRYNQTGYEDTTTNKPNNNNREVYK